MAKRSRVQLGELLVSAGLLTLGAYVLHQVQSITQTASYEQIGPRLFPLVVGAALVIFSLVLTWQALAGGWRNMPEGQEEHKTPDWVSFGLIGAALVLQMVLMKAVGFVLASTLLFVLVARGFGSKRWKRDLAIGAAVSIAAFVLFTAALDLSLPASPFGV